MENNGGAHTDSITRISTGVIRSLRPEMGRQEVLAKSTHTDNTTIFITGANSLFFYGSLNQRRTRVGSIHRTVPAIVPNNCHSRAVGSNFTTLLDIQQTALGNDKATAHRGK